MMVQKEIIQTQGPANPMVCPMEFRNTLEDIMSISGMKNVSRYFKQITPRAARRGAQGAVREA